MKTIVAAWMSTDPATAVRGCLDGDVGGEEDSRVRPDLDTSASDQVGGGQGHRQGGVH